MIKKAISITIVFVLVFAMIIQAGAVTAFAENTEENEQVITISDINFSPSKGEAGSSTKIRALMLPSADIVIIGEEWSCPDEITISGKSIQITSGTYSYKLTFRADKTLTFNNDLEIYYQGINGRYLLDYEIDQTDNHIMTVTGTFENIIIESPLLNYLSDKSKNWILSHITEDSYFYKLILRTAEGFSFTNMLKFLFDSRQLGYSLDYAYDLQTEDHSLVINGIGDCCGTGSESQTGDQDALHTEMQIDALHDTKNVKNTGAEDSLNGLFILNDVDGDGEVTIYDVTLTQRYIAHLDVPDDFDTASADADGDGAVTSLDITRIQRSLAKLDVDY